ncbi:amidohydrolase [Pukyongiella litopenaei]|uniref:Amidohydrolase n=1 Tax=Pukyongiella litopenaei TaxID=2605946 RepID=A0A2S0MSN9_9RHOB|nr:amidohydrolase [Pukyongiella litopenaei]AVO38918.1 amidohydrolase [Pukyongiella litopenaei]
MTHADTIVTNGRVLTMDDTMPRAEAVALAAGCILAVGGADEIAALAGAATEVIDAGGGSVLPGFVESHLHLFTGGAELNHLHLDGCDSEPGLRRLLGDYAARRPDLPLVVGQGPDYGLFAGVVPRLLLDDIVADRPVALMAHDHHTVWANSAALRAAGVLHGRQTPDGHEVVMGADGLATGELLEPEAYGPVLALSGYFRSMLGLSTGREPDPAPDAEQRASDLADLARGLAHANAAGITSLVNMDGNFYTLDLLEELRRRGDLTARVRVPFHFLPEMEMADLDAATEMTGRWQDDWLCSGFVKMFMDGVIDSGTAFMKHDYPDRPGWRAHGRFEADRFARIATEIDRRGLQIAVHSIGDAATERVLDGYAAARRANGDSGLRHRVEHIELIDPADIPRLSDLGLIASMQPAHAPGCCGVPHEPTLTKIGRPRWNDAFAWRRIADSGAALALASDWPVSDISVLRGIHAAVTREAWCDDVPNQRLTLDEALRGYTIGGAHAEHSEAKKGSLSPGKLADLVILDRDIEAVDPAEIEHMRVRRTICGGRTVFTAA